MRFFAAVNHLGFSNSWEVLAFSNKVDRDTYVTNNSGKVRKDNLVQCVAVKKSQIGDYIGRPKPFSGKYFAIVDYASIMEVEMPSGYMGYVDITNLDYNPVSGVRLNS